MQIKEVLKYDWNYAEYIVSDGKNELVCMCDSVPLPLGQVPKVGMKVLQLYAFTYNGIQLTKLTENVEQESLILKRSGYFEYDLRGKIVDKNIPLICVEGFSISLEKEFDGGLPNEFKDGDIVELLVDRLDCILTGA